MVAGALLAIIVASRCMASVIWCANRELQFADLQSNLEQGQNLEATIRLREELAEHRRALLQMQEMAAKYGYDISRPARNAQEAVQWLYFAYLAAVKSQNGGAMSLGRTASFLDIYIERDFNAGLLTEQQAQELIDHFIMKIRMVRFLRTPEFDSLFSGDPIWATEVIGGMGLDGRTLVTKNSFRYLHTLHTMGPAPEPNLTILWFSVAGGIQKICCAGLHRDLIFAV